ncbi:MAG: hypothetical protein P8M20_02785, partial [Planctomycetaceae bacterium]|nr:hypothetical protein [Planctomycetaceae bacterium]
MKAVELPMRCFRVQIFLLLVALSIGIAEINWTFAEENTLPTSIERLDIFPARMELPAAGLRSHFLVSAIDPSGRLIDATRVAKFKSLDSQVAVVEQGAVVAVAAGVAKVLATVDGRMATLHVIVGKNQGPPISLRNEVVPVLSRQGCSSGACHGSPKGKGGFRLSLRGFDLS